MSVGILGYGNLGKALYRQLLKKGESVCVFSDREECREGREGVFYSSAVLREGNIPLDVLYLAHGSHGGYRNELLGLCERYHLVSVYDIHSELASFKEEIDNNAKLHQTVTIFGIGWDPGLLSLARVLSKSVFPETDPKTQWGEGVSEGHSFAIRQIQGVREGIQYTVPTEGSHRRVCYIVADEREQSSIRTKILGMSEYFSVENTEIHFISEEEFKENHKGNCFHRGRVYQQLPDKSAELLFLVSMKSNPDFTARIMIAYSVALTRLFQEKRFGAFGPLDIPLSYLLPEQNCSFW